jgi:glycosyltransferase involved in cell wall biosynthesis
MPMPDNPWTRGKSAYKALVYMSAGIPVLADDVGVAGDVVGDRESGAIVSGDADWVGGLEWLSDAKVRSACGAAGRARVEQSYSVERWAPVMASILRGEL